MTIPYRLMLEAVEKCNQPGAPFGHEAEMLGEGTEYEAVAEIWQGDDGPWWGRVVFKDARFSPCTEDYPGLEGWQWEYPCFEKANGIAAMSQAKRTWEVMVGIFKSLQAKVAE